MLSWETEWEVELSRDGEYQYLCKALLCGRVLIYALAAFFAISLGQQRNKGPPPQSKAKPAPKAGAYTRPLFNSTRAVSDTKCTLDNPYSPLTPPKHPVNNT